MVRVTERRAHISVLVLLGGGTGAGTVVRSTFRNFTLRSVVVVVASSTNDSTVAINWVYKQLVTSLAQLCLATSAGDLGMNGSLVQLIPSSNFLAIVPDMGVNGGGERCNSC